MQHLVKRPLSLLNRMDVRERTLRGVGTLLECTPFTEEERSVIEAAEKILQQTLERRCDFVMTQDEIESTQI